MKRLTKRLYSREQGLYFAMNLSQVNNDCRRLCVSSNMHDHYLEMSLKDEGDALTYT